MNEVSAIEVSEMDAGEDSELLLNVLSSVTFSKLPPVNANRMFAGMEKGDASADQDVITQGKPGTSNASLTAPPVIASEDQGHVFQLSY